jgi:hypothetical protein
MKESWWSADACAHLKQCPLKVLPEVYVQKKPAPTYLYNNNNIFRN